MREIVCARSRYRNQRQKFETFENNCDTLKVIYSFTTDWQGRKRMSNGDSRTGMFHQTRVSAGDTACSVIRVYGQLPGASDIKLPQYLKFTGLFFEKLLL